MPELPIDILSMLSLFARAKVAATAPAAALGAHMVKRLRAFAGMSRMKRLALVVLARTLTDNDVKRLRVSVGSKCTDGFRFSLIMSITIIFLFFQQELFAAMDTNQDGRIDSEDLHNALAKVTWFE